MIPRKPNIHEQQVKLCCVFLLLVYPMLQVSLDCPFLIALSIFSNVYLHLSSLDIQFMLNVLDASKPKDMSMLTITPLMWLKDY
jgi:hypothetical protein